MANANGQTPTPTPSVVTSIFTITQSAYIPPPTTQSVTSTVTPTPIYSSLPPTSFNSSPNGSFYGTRTILGPLTTTFTPPEACQTPVAGDIGNGPFLFYGINCPIGSDGASAQNLCFPSGFVNNAGDTGDFSSSALQVYAPAIGCPQNWLSACGASRIDNSRILGDQYLSNWLNAGEAMQVCCPNGWQCSFPTSTFKTPAPGDNPVIKCTITTTESIHLLVSYCPNAGVGGLIETSDFVPSSQGAPPIALLIATTTTPSTQSPSTEPQSGLSSSAKIGIGVGVPLGLLLILTIALVIWLLFFRKQGSGFFNSREYKHELDASGGEKQPTIIAELEGAQPAELEGTSKPVEVDGTSSPIIQIDLRNANHPV